MDDPDAKLRIFFFNFAKEAATKVRITRDKFVLLHTTQKALVSHAHCCTTHLDSCQCIARDESKTERENGPLRGRFLFFSNLRQTQLGTSGLGRLLRRNSYRTLSTNIRNAPTAISSYTHVECGEVNAKYCGGLHFIHSMKGVKAAPPKCLRKVIASCIMWDSGARFRITAEGKRLRKVAAA